jgi:phage terminase small subunit
MKRRPPAPKHLATATKRWWQSVVAAYVLEDHHLRLLQLAAEAFDRCTSAREAIDQHGATYTDRFGAPRMRPEVSIERDCRLAFARLIRELDLDVEPPAPGTRPPSLRSNRGGIGYAG